MNRFNRAMDIFFSPVPYIGVILGITLTCISAGLLGLWSPITLPAVTIGGIIGGFAWAYFQAWLDEEHGEKLMKLTESKKRHIMLQHKVARALSLIGSALLAISILIRSVNVRLPLMAAGILLQIPLWVVIYKTKKTLLRLETKIVVLEVLKDLMETDAKDKKEK